MTISDTRRQDIHQRQLAIEGKSFPIDEHLRFFVDFATIEHVDLKTKQVFARPWHINSIPVPCQWASPLFDPITGHGMHFTPKSGMHGVIMSINESAVFLTFIGLMDEKAETGFSDDREEIDFGAGCFRTSQETKQIWSPNFLLLQAANLCRTIMSRAKKEIDATFFNLKGTSPGGSFAWLATPSGDRAVTLDWEIRNKVRPGRDAKGNLRKDDAVVAKLNAGTSEGGKRMLGINLARVETKAKGTTLLSKDLLAFGSTQEAVPVQAFRALLTDRMQQNGVTSFEDFKKKDADLFALVVPADPQQKKIVNSTEHPTVDLIIEALVAEAGFVDPDDGLAKLKPKAAKTRESGFIEPANPLEAAEDAVNEKKEEDEEKTTILSDMLEKARETKDSTQTPKLQQKLDLAIAESGDIIGSQEEGLAWELQKILKIVSKKGNFEFDAGEGMIVRARRGHVILGNRACGISFGQDGTIKLLGKSIEIEPVDELPGDQVTNLGTSFKMSAGGVIMNSGGEITMQAKGKIHQKPGQAPQPNQRSIKQARSELVAKPKIPGVKE